MFRAFGTRNTHEFADVLHDVPSIGRLSLSLPPFLISFLADRFFSLSLRWSIRERSWRGRWQPRHATPSLSLPRILACKSSSIINRGFQEIIEPPNFPSHDDYATLDRISVNKRGRKGRKTRSGRAERREEIGYFCAGLYTATRSRPKKNWIRGRRVRPSVALQMKTLNNLVAGCKSRRGATLIDTYRCVRRYTERL